MFSHLNPESYTPFSSPHLPQSNATRISLIKLVTLSTVSVTKKITVICAVYFYNSGSIFATKNFVLESVLKVRSFMRVILASLDRGKCGLEDGV